MSISSDPIDPFIQEREWMIQMQIEARGIHNKAVHEAMRNVPRHEFVSEEYKLYAYQDMPLPLGYGQTISQPYIVAFMTQAIDPKGTDRVLEIGTGCGYQAAVLAQICKDVYTVEIVEPLAKKAQETLQKLGYLNIQSKIGDGYEGWSEEAPFDAIIVTAACPVIPEPLIQQLKIGGQMVLPLDEPFGEQILIKAVKTEEGLIQKQLFPVRFVPLTGKGEAH